MPGLVGWIDSALITLSSAVLPLSLTTPTLPLSLCCLYIAVSPARRRRPFIYASEQVCIGWRKTGACYTNKLTFSHGFSFKVWGVLYKYAYYIRFFYGMYVCMCINGGSVNVCSQVHLQTQQKGKIGLIKMGIKVLKSDGIFGLYNGLTASLLRQVT